MSWGFEVVGSTVGKPSSSIYFQVAPHGGIRPVARHRSRLALTLSECEEISRGIIKRYAGECGGRGAAIAPSALQSDCYTLPEYTDCCASEAR
jgi:hypothetical protein